MTLTWKNWAGFKAEIQRQFGVIEVKGEARIRPKKMKPGKQLVTEYWNEFRLVARAAELDYSTRGELLLDGINTELETSLGQQQRGI